MSSDFLSLTAHASGWSRSLAYQWIRIIHRCWIDRQPYDESIYLNALKKRGSPLLAFIAADAAQKPA